ncbi:hypothetical protein GCM10022222_08850 [Amycolatopsis ultiminotia]|uniref:Uncharacterized protein n=1 Tax=Amycolatopsis ultiminotia TaxID=543629 RepID=A0ABP6V458_9PSEU
MQSPRFAVEASPQQLDLQGAFIMNGHRTLPVLPAAAPVPAAA